MKYEAKNVEATEAIPIPKHDRLFHRPGQLDNGSFEFSGEVVEVFDDMLRRSVPLYDLLQDTIADLVLTTNASGPICDLGCSTGNTLEAISRHANERLELIGVDKSDKMLDACRHKLRHHTAHDIQYVRWDIAEAADFPIPKCSAIIMSLVAQFVRPLYREDILRRIHSLLLLGGRFIFVEKIVHDSPEVQRLLIERYESLKRKNGYSRTEIARKRKSLENRLIPFTQSENLQILRRAGFREVEVFFSYLNFQGYLAIKR